MSATGGTPGAVAARMVDAALALLDLLDPQQRAIAQRPFPSDDDRRQWWYTPVDHGGLPLRAMGPRAQQTALRLVASGLSTAGFVTVSTIMGIENVLDADEGWRPPSRERERVRDPLLYFLRIFGAPGGDAWAWRFGGHHVSLHHLVLGGEVAASTPCFFGLDPASSPLLGPHPLRPLAGVEDLARQLVRSLDDEQMGSVVVAPVAPSDLVGGNRPHLSEGGLPLPLKAVWRDADERTATRLDAADAAYVASSGLTDADLEAVRFTASPRGIAASALRADQRELLGALLDCYLHRLPDGVADEELAKVRGDNFDTLHFLWAGGLEPGQGHYYRVQNDAVVVEYDNAQRGANHVHSVWRDPRNDFGDDALSRHRRDYPH